MSEPIVPRFLSDLSEEEKRHVLEKRKGQTNPPKRTLTTQRGSCIQLLHREAKESLRGPSDETCADQTERLRLADASLPSDEFPRGVVDLDRVCNNHDSNNCNVQVDSEASRAECSEEFRESVDNQVIHRTPPPPLPQDVHCDLCGRGIPFLMGIGPIHHAIALHGQQPEGLSSLPPEPEFLYDRCPCCHLFFDKFSFSYHRCQSSGSNLQTCEA